MISIGGNKKNPKFVHGTKTHMIHYVAQSSLELVGFTDSNWEGDNTDRKYTYIYLFMI